MRVLCDSMMYNDGVVAADRTIRLKPATSLLKHEVGDAIALTQGDFRLLAAGFLAEIGRKYS